MADGEPPAPGPVEINGTTYKPLADGEYDVICLGTGLKECILAGMLAHKGRKVFMLDRNSYYGGETASLDLFSLYRKFVKDEEAPKEWLDRHGANRDFNVDLVPKFIMADGKLVKTLLVTGVVRYLEATGINKVDGTYVFSQAAGKGMFSNGRPGIEKVPGSESEAVSTPLLGMMQKMALRSFLGFVRGCEGPVASDGTPLTEVPMEGVYRKYGLDEDTQEFVGHAMALQTTDDYKKRPAYETIKAIRLYAQSLARHGGCPFLYPVYGLSTLPEAFSRDCAVRGGTFMLNRGIEGIIRDSDGKVLGVRSKNEDGEEEAAKAPVVIGDPSYFDADMCEKHGQVIRTILILNKRPACLPDGIDSAQIIIPQKQVGRKNDTYVSILSGSHMVVKKGMYLAIVATTVETADPKKEVDSGIALIGADRIVTRFDNIVDNLVPKGDGSDGLHISSSYDATSHFETTMTDVAAMYKRIIGEDFDFENKEKPKDPGAAAGGGGTA